MAYIALKKFKGDGLMPGDLIPNIEQWQRIAPWENQGWIKEVPDSEIKDGKWSKWGTQAAKGFLRGGVKTGNHTPGMEKPKAEAKPEPKAETTKAEPKVKEPTNEAEARKLMSGWSKKELTVMAREFDLDVGITTGKNALVKLLLPQWAEIDFGA